MLHLYHIRKTGGRSFELAWMHQFQNPNIIWSRCFGGAGQTDPIVKVEGKRIAPWDQIPPPDVDFSWSHIPQGRTTLPDDALTMTILRDPVQRFISLYRNVLRVSDQPATELYREFKSVLGANILETALRLQPVQRYEILHMFSPTLNVNEAMYNIRQLRYWFRLESYEHGLQWLRRQLNLELPLLRYRDTRKGKEVNRRLREEITVTTIRELVDLFEPEYELLAYFGYQRPRRVRLVEGRPEVR